jgi:hypothetical protein
VLVQRHLASELHSRALEQRHKLFLLELLIDEAVERNRLLEIDFLEEEDWYLEDSEDTGPDYTVSVKEKCEELDRLRRIQDKVRFSLREEREKKRQHLSLVESGMPIVTGFEWRSPRRRRQQVPGSKSAEIKDIPLLLGGIDNRPMPGKSMLLPARSMLPAGRSMLLPGMDQFFLLEGTDQKSAMARTG